MLAVAVTRCITREHCAGGTLKIVSILWGDRSEIIRRHSPASGAKDFIPPHAPRIVIPDSEHHIMVDQPLALVASLRTLLALWPA